MKIRAIITGATGMVGEGVLHECLLDKNVEKVLIINRKPAGYSHPKLEEIIHNDFFDLAAIKEQLEGYNACYFCLGVTSVGLKEPAYYHLTYELTLSAAKVFSDVNPEMTFCYVSGAGTDSSEEGNSMWARVKGKTENDLQQLPFKKVFLFRPGFMNPTKGLKNTQKLYHFVGWLYPIMRKVFPKYVITLKELAEALLGVTVKGYSSAVIEVEDIVKVAEDYRRGAKNERAER